MSQGSPTELSPRGGSFAVLHGGSLLPSTGIFLWVHPVVGPTPFEAMVFCSGHVCRCYVCLCSSVEGVSLSS